MKILVIGYIDGGSGGAIGAKRLCQALIEAGNDVSFYVNRKTGTDNFVYELPLKKGLSLRKIIKKIAQKSVKLLYKSSNGILHSMDIISYNDIKWINESNYDVVHLHWISDAISIADLAKINKPLVWTMHDSWACCGAEHHPNIMENDTRWKDGYYKSNKPKSTKGIDLCRYIWEVKKNKWKDLNIKFIAPSKWETSVLKDSYLFRNEDCTTIPNILPFDVFYERNKLIEREKRNIPLNKKILGFGAATGMDDPKSMKGTYYLLEALKKLDNKDDYFLVIFGAATSAFTSLLPIPYYCSGYIEDENIMAEIYSCCDCFINSSIIENFGYTIFESLACGTPVIGFDVGGSSDLIENKVNGYLAKPYSSEDLVNGIKYCIDNNEIREECKKVKEKFTKDKVVQAHMDVYRRAINSRENKTFLR